MSLAGRHAEALLTPHRGAAVGMAGEKLPALAPSAWEAIHTSHPYRHVDGGIGEEA